MIKFADLFAGGGGVSTGAYSIPGIHVSWALNHDPTAIKVHEINHPETKHYQADIRTQNVNELEPVDILWASLECTEHSKAKGGKSKNTGSFTLGWELHRYLKACDPLVLMIENVPEFVRWGELKDGKRVKNKEGLEYLKWVKSIKDLGFVNYERRFLNAADYGCPTRRIRYFGIFTKSGIQMTWPKPTHCETENNLFGLKKWKSCKDYIKLASEGNSIFGRVHNENIRPHLRKQLSPNTLRRIAGGIRKFAPEMYFIMKYYGNSTEGNNFNCHSVDDPLHTVTTKDRHTLIKIEKKQFIQDYCFNDNFDRLDQPLRTQLTRQTKQLITVEKQFLDDQYGRDNTAQSLERPSTTITTANSKKLVSVKANFLSKYYNGIRKDGGEQHHCQSVDAPYPTIRTIDGTALVCAQFISPQYNSNGKPEANNQSIDKPLKTITTQEKFQFISAYFNSGGNPESQNQSIEKPCNTILTGANKKALVTADIVDFDIKMRFLDDEELASIMGFPEGYFKNELSLSKKQIIKLIGNAVPVDMAKALIEPITQIVEEFNFIKQEHENQTT